LLQQNHDIFKIKKINFSKEKSLAIPKNLQCILLAMKVGAKRNLAKKKSLM